MIRILRILNCIGIVALAALCVMQWRIDRRLNLENSQLQESSTQQLVLIEERERTIKGLTADLEDFRQRISLAEVALKDSQDKFKSLASDRDQLESERDQLKETIPKWTQAVSERDDALKQANDMNLKVAADRNDAVSKFNELATRFNALVESETKAQKKP